MSLGAPYAKTSEFGLSGDSVVSVDTSLGSFTRYEDSGLRNTA